MKYIRTKDGRIAEIKDNMIVKQSDVLRLVYKDKPYICVLNGDDEIIKQADNIEELCDTYVIVGEDKNAYGYPLLWNIKQDMPFLIKYYLENNIIYGAIWTEEGLIYVAKMKETEKMKRIRIMLNILNEEIKILTELINSGINEQTVILQLKHTEMALDNLKKEYNYDR